MTCPFLGLRYTVIFFIDQQFGRITEAQRSGLEATGFRVPAPCSRGSKAAVSKGGKRKLEHARAFINANGGSTESNRPPTKQIKQTSITSMFGGKARLL